MKEARFKALGDRSEAIYGHRHVLPVAVWISENGCESVTQPEIRGGLGGLSPSNKILRALERLEEVGAVRELPYLGRPNSRIFERRDCAQWKAIGEYAAEVDSSVDLSDDEE